MVYGPVGRSARSLTRPAVPGERRRLASWRAAQDQRIRALAAKGVSFGRIPGQTGIFVHGIRQLIH